MIVQLVELNAAVTGMRLERATDEELRVLGEIVAPVDPTLHRLLEATERFMDPKSPRGYSETHRALRDAAIEARGKVGGRPAGVIPYVWGGPGTPWNP